MIPFRIHLLSCFRNPMRLAYAQGYDCVTVRLAGRESFRFNGIDVDPRQPFILLSPKGTRIMAEGGTGRETWGMKISSDAWRATSQPDLLEIRLNELWVRLPMLTRLDEGHVLHWRREMRLLRECFSNPVPLNRARLELGVMHILRFVVEQSIAEVGRESPAHALKTLLDDPGARHLSLAALCRELHYTPDHLRVRFQSTYGITPGAYRAQVRMTEAMEQIANTDLSIKEIGFAVGFKHVSYFSRSFKQAFGLTPREAVARYRRY